MLLYVGVIIDLEFYKTQKGCSLSAFVLDSVLGFLARAASLEKETRELERWLRR